MCPSKKPFEKQFFSQLVAQAKQTGKPVSIAISITGLWIMHHDQAFAWLLQKAKLGSIILVHGNEPQGIALFTQLQEKNRFHLPPLSQAFRR